MTELGHVVFYVRELERSVQFYTNIVGLSMKGKIFNDKAAILTSGRTHHELLLIQIGEAEGPMKGRRIGLYHTGWKIGDSLNELKMKFQQLKNMNYPIDGMSDHLVSHSLYLQDPDGNEIELYVDNPDYDWREDNSWMDTPVRPLTL